MLQRIAENVWGWERVLKLGAGFDLETRATVLRLESGELAIHSPLRVDDALGKEIDALGDVRFLIAPSTVHWMFLGAAAERWPKARVLGPPGLHEKAPGLTLEELPVDAAVPGSGDELVVRRIEGVPSLNEHAFLHASSRSLLVTDVVFNVHASESLMTRLILRCDLAWQRPAVGLLWRLLVRDRARAAASARTMLGWDFERVVVGHGDVIADDAQAILQTVLARLAAG